MENASGATKQKLPVGKVPISKNFAFLACVSYLWPSLPSKIGMRSTALVGFSALRSSAILSIILDIAFSCVPKLLKGGFMYVFFPERKYRTMHQTTYHSCMQRSMSRRASNDAE